jgi:sodium-coupled neutral amino acid transporter 10
MFVAPALACKARHAFAPQSQRKWVWRRRAAVALLVFGVVAGVACTDAILGAVKEEAEVVQLAQQLVVQQTVAQEAGRRVK